MRSGRGDLLWSPVLGLVPEHRAEDAQESIGDSSEGLAVAVSSGAQGGVASLGDRVVMRCDSGPVVESVAHSWVAGSAHDHDELLAAAAGDWRNT
jgi:hypothetical protein